MLNDFVAEIHHVFYHPLEILIDTLKFRIFWMRERAIIIHQPFSVFQMPVKDGKEKFTISLLSQEKQMFDVASLMKSQYDFKHALDLFLKLCALLVQQA